MKRLEIVIQKVRVSLMNKVLILFSFSLFASCRCSLNNSLSNYSKCGDFHNGLAYVIDKDGKMGFISKKGDLVIPCDYLPRIYEGYNNFCDGYCVITNGINKTGVIDTLGRQVLPLKYKFVSNVRNNNIRGVIDSNNVASYVKEDGTFLFGTNLKLPRDFSYGRACYLESKHWGFIDVKGNVVIPCVYDKCSTFSCGYSLCSIKDTSYFIDVMNNRFKLPYNHKAHNFSDGYAIFECNGKIGAYNTKLEVVVPSIYDKLGMYPNYYVANIGSKYLIINKGDTVWNSSKYRIQLFSTCGYHVISDSLKTIGVIDSTGSVILSDKYDRIDYFVNGYAVVQKGGKQGLVNKKLEVVIPCKYKVCHNMSEGYVLTYRKKKFKYIKVK